MYERFYEGVGESWQTNALMKNAQLEGGAGLGFGVQVQCNDKVVVTIGGGAGTGFAGVYGNMTAGGGGGAGLQGRAIHAYMFVHTYMHTCLSIHTEPGRCYQRSRCACVCAAHGVTWGVPQRMTHPARNCSRLVEVSVPEATARASGCLSVEWVSVSGVLHITDEHDATATGGGGGVHMTAQNIFLPSWGTSSDPDQVLRSGFATYLPADSATETKCCVRHTGARQVHLGDTCFRDARVLLQRWSGPSCQRRRWRRFACFLTQ